MTLFRRDTLLLLFFLNFSKSYSKSDLCLKQFDNAVYKPHPDMYLRTPQVISKYGFGVEKHKVVTEDGYILTLYRIPPQKTKKRKKGTITVPQKYPVYLNHGLFANGHIWLLQPGTRNLAFKLANESFDVWLGNGRGTRESLQHNKYKSSDSYKYWNFTFHEMGIYDVPATIHFIRNITGKDKVSYIGHSMGTTELFVALSEKPELNKYVAIAILYAPVAYLSNTESIGRWLAPMANEIYLLTLAQLKGRFNGLNFFEDKFGQKMGELCSYSALACGICSDINAKLFGHDPLQTNYTLLPLFLSHVPDSVSTKTLLHFMQLINSGKFQKFDYGNEEDNEKHYGKGQTTPPDYDLSKYNVPTIFFWSDNDNLATPRDVNITASKLREGVIRENIRVKWFLWTHRDFIKGIDADKLVYEKTISILKKQKFYDA